MKESQQPIGVHRRIRLDSDDAPDERLDRRLSLSIAQGDLVKSMHAAVKYDDDLSADDRKVDDVGADRMLATNDDAKPSERSQRFPRGDLGRIRLAPQTPRQRCLLSIAHGAVVPENSAPDKNKAPHPRPLSRERERGEGARQ